MGEINIADLFRSTAREYAGKTAVVWLGDAISFDAFDRDVSRIARYLNRRGVRRNDRIGICLPNSIGSLAAGLGVMRAGATAVPLDFRLKPPSLAELIDAFDIAAVLVEPRMPAQSEKWIVTDEAWWRTIESIEPSDTSYPPPADLASILLTSGTTGQPLGTGRSHGEMMTRARQNRAYRPNGAGDVYLNALPLSFSAGFVVTIGALLQGATTVMMPSIFSAEQMVEAVERHGVTSTLLVPTTLRSLFSLAPSDRPLFEGLGFLGCGGAPLFPEEKTAAYERLSPAFGDVYASSLGGVISILSGPDVMTHPDSVGRPLPGVTIEIVDDANVRVPSGTTGNIRLKSSGITPTLIGERNGGAAGDRIVNGWIYTGELGRIDANGFLYLAGRASDMMLVGGINVFPDEISGVLKDHPSVRDVAVISRPSDKHGEEPVAFAVVRDRTTPQELISHCVAKLPSFKVPRLVITVDALPYNAHGKIDAERLRAMLP